MRPFIGPVGSHESAPSCFRPRPTTAGRCSRTTPVTVSPGTPRPMCPVSTSAPAGRSETAWSRPPPRGPMSACTTRRTPSQTIRQMRCTSPRRDLRHVAPAATAMPRPRELTIQCGRGKPPLDSPRVNTPRTLVPQLVWPRLLTVPPDVLGLRVHFQPRPPHGHVVTGDPGDGGLSERALQQQHVTGPVVVTHGRILHAVTDMRPNEYPAFRRGGPQRAPSTRANSSENSARHHSQTTWQPHRSAPHQLPTRIGRDSRSRLYLVRVETPTPGRPSGRGGNSRSGSTVASTEGPAPHGRGTRRPQGRPPHQDPGPRIAVRPPRTRTKTYFCRRTFHD